MAALRAPRWRTNFDSRRSNRVPHDWLSLTARTTAQEPMRSGRGAADHRAGRMQSSERRVSGFGKPAGMPGAVTGSAFSIFAATC